MKQFENEDEFQQHIVTLCAMGAAHAQQHSDPHSVGVPDLSVAWGGFDFWLELKYDEFTIDRDPYDKFAFSKMRRTQLEWLLQRRNAGRSICGVLGYFRVKPLRLTHYLFYMSPGEYLRCCWPEGKVSAAAVILTMHTVPAEDIKNISDLAEFICRADDLKRIRVD